MKFFLIIFTFFSFTTSYGQLKVANYSFGKYGTKTYEHLAFWIENDKRAYVEYSYGTEPTEVKLIIVEKKNVDVNESIIVKFSNGYILHILPNGLKLNVRDENGKYFRTFEWEYEGPIDGRGTFCEICAEGEKEAMKLIKKNYLQ